MSGLREQAANGLQKGDTFRTSRIFTEDEVLQFARISRDYNPVHFDDRFVKVKKFPAPICHGLLTASLITEIGGQVGWLASGMTFRFKGPVYIGEEVTCSLVIDSLDNDGRARAQVSITNQEGVEVIEAEISGIVPGPEERKVLSQMLSEGDPTNGLTSMR